MKHCFNSGQRNGIQLEKSASSKIKLSRKLIAKHTSVD